MDNPSQYFTVMTIHLDRETLVHAVPYGQACLPGEDCWCCPRVEVHEARNATVFIHRPFQPN